MTTATTDRTESDGDRTTESLAELPPSAKLVAKVLEYEGQLTGGRLAEETLLPERTVRHALTHLEDAGCVESRVSLTDARRRVYTLTDC